MKQENTHPQTEQTEEQGETVEWNEQKEAAKQGEIHDMLVRYAAIEHMSTTEFWELVQEIQEWSLEKEQQLTAEREATNKQLQSYADKVRELSDGLRDIEQMSDCGSYPAAICKMKSIATELLTLK